MYAFLSYLNSNKTISLEFFCRKREDPEADFSASLIITGYFIANFMLKVG